MLVKVMIIAEKRVIVLPVCCQLKRQGKLEGMAEGIEYSEEDVADEEGGVGREEGVGGWGRGGGGSGGGRLKQ